MRDTSLACLLDLGLKSQSRATRSHSVPGLFSSRPEIMASSAALHAPWDRGWQTVSGGRGKMHTRTRKALRQTSAEHKHTRDCQKSRSRDDLSDGLKLKFQ